MAERQTDTRFWGTKLAELVPDESMHHRMLDSSSRAFANTISNKSQDEVNRELETQARICRNERNTIEHGGYQSALAGVING